MYYIVLEIILALLMYKTSFLLFFFLFASSFLVASCDFTRKDKLEKVGISSGESVILEPKSFDFDKDGVSDLHVSFIKRKSGSRIFFESKDNKDGVGFMAFYIQNRLSVGHADLDGDGIYEKLVVFDEKEEALAAFEKKQQGIYEAISLKEIKDFWPMDL